MPNVLRLINDHSLVLITRGKGRNGNSRSSSGLRVAQSRRSALRSCQPASPSGCWLAGTSASATSPCEGRAADSQPQPPGTSAPSWRDLGLPQRAAASPLATAWIPTSYPSPEEWRPRQPGRPRLVRTGLGRQGPVPQGPAAASRPPKRCGRRASAAKTPRILYRGKSGSSSKMGRQGLGGAGAAGRSMQRSQSRSSLSASFEALAGYFPCMNSLEEEEGGEPVVIVSVYISHLGKSVVGGLTGLENSR